MFAKSQALKNRGRRVGALTRFINQLRSNDKMIQSKIQYYPDHVRVGICNS
jgi:hypothetical protein